MASTESLFLFRVTISFAMNIFTAALSSAIIIEEAKNKVAMKKIFNTNFIKNIMLKTLVPNAHKSLLGS